MGAAPPSLGSISPSVATNAAVVLHGNFVPIDHVFRASANGADIGLDDVEVWTSFDPVNPSSERYFLVRPANGSWPAASRVTLEVHRLPPGVPRSTMRVRSPRVALPISPSASPSTRLVAGSALAHRFDVETLAGPAHAPPVVGTFGAPYEQTHRLPIHGEQILLHIPHAAMESATSAVLWLEIGLERDRSEFETWLGGAVLTNRPGVLAMRPFGGGLLPALVEATLIDTTGASVVFHPRRGVPGRT